MAIHSQYIDPTDNRIKKIICVGCFSIVWVEKGSQCETYLRCTTCCDGLLKGFGKKLTIL